MKKIKDSTIKLGVDVDDSLHEGVGQIMAEQSHIVQQKYAPNTFHRLFWEQQENTMTILPKQRRWHPTLIRWCLHLKMLSSAAYSEVRQVLTLPCGRTLQDYTHWIISDCGVQPKMTEQLKESLAESHKHVAVVFEEVKIKEGLVFVDIGDINSALLSIEGSGSKPSVAKHILVFLIQGILFKLNFLYAQYLTFDLSADLFFPMVWEVVRSLESAGSG